MCHLLFSLEWTCGIVTSDKFPLLPFSETHHHWKPCPCLSVRSSLHCHKYQGLLHSFPLPALSTHQKPVMCVGFNLGLAPEYSNSIFCLTWLAGAPLKLTVNLNLETLSVGSYFFPFQHTIFQHNQPVWGSWFFFLKPSMYQLVRSVLWVFNLNILPGSWIPCELLKRRM